MDRTKDAWRPSRRTVLQQFVLGCAGGLLAACGLTPQKPHVAPWKPVDTDPALQNSPSNQVADEADTPGDNGLDAFLALSALLTGVPNLSRALGRVYWQSLQDNNPSAISLSTLLEQTGFGASDPPTTLDALTATGVFEQEETRTLLDTITRYWYTGVYQNATGESTVATFTDSLAWEVLAFTKPQSLCGAPGFWEKRPEVVVGALVDVGTR